LWITCGLGLDNFESKGRERRFSTGRPQVIHRCPECMYAVCMESGVKRLLEAVEHNQDYQTQLCMVWYGGKLRIMHGFLPFARGSVRPGGGRTSGVVRAPLRTHHGPRLRERAPPLRLGRSSTPRQGREGLPGEALRARRARKLQGGNSCGHVRSTRRTRAPSKPGESPKASERA
jgi:hypothetical protein